MIEFVNGLCCDVNRTFCRTVTVYEFKILWRCKWNKPFTARKKIFERVVVNFGCKLSCNLCCHKCVGDSVIFKISVQPYKVKSDVLLNNVKLGTADKRRIHFTEAGVKTVACICRNNAVFVNVRVSDMKIAE